MQYLDFCEMEIDTFQGLRGRGFRAPSPKREIKWQDGSDHLLIGLRKSPGLQKLTLEVSPSLSAKPQRMCKKSNEDCIDN